MNCEWQAAPLRHGLYWAYHPEKCQGHAVICQVSFDGPVGWYVEYPGNETKYHFRTAVGWLWQPASRPLPPGETQREG